MRWQLQLHGRVRARRGVPRGTYLIKLPTRGKFLGLAESVSHRIFVNVAAEGLLDDGIETVDVLIKAKLRQQAAVNSLSELARCAKFTQLHAARSHFLSLAHAHDVRIVHHQSCHLAVVVHPHIFTEAIPG